MDTKLSALLSVGKSFKAPPAPQLTLPAPSNQQDAKEGYLAFSSESGSDSDAGEGKKQDKKKKKKRKKEGEEGGKKKRRKTDSDKGHGGKEKKERKKDKKKKHRHQKQHRESDKSDLSDTSDSDSVKRIDYDRSGEHGGALVVRKPAKYVSSSGPSKSEQPSWSIDKRGDKATYEMGGLYRLDVPLYHGIGRSLPKRQRAPGGDRDSDVSDRYFGAKARENSRTVPLPLWRWKYARPEQRGGDITRPLDAQEVVHMDTENTKDSLSLVPSVEKSGFLPLPPVVHGPAAEEQELSGESKEQSVARRTRAANEALRANPGNVALWLEFIHFQEEAVTVVHRANRSRISDTAVAERKLAVLEKALHANPNSLPLRLEQISAAISAGAGAEATDRLFRRSLVKCHQNPALWTIYARTLAGTFPLYTAPDYREVIEAALHAMKQEREKSASGAQTAVTAAQVAKPWNIAMVELAWISSLGELLAGYSERSVGLLQALVEFNIIAPTDATVADFEAFWDSDFPRIGEDTPGEAGMSVYLQMIRKEEESARQRNLDRRIAAAAAAGASYETADTNTDTHTLTANTSTDTNTSLHTLKTNLSKDNSIASNGGQKHSNLDTDEGNISKERSAETEEHSSQKDISSKKEGKSNRGGPRRMRAADFFNDFADQSADAEMGKTDEGLDKEDTAAAVIDAVRRRFSALPEASPRTSGVEEPANMPDQSVSNITSTNKLVLPRPLRESASAAFENAYNAAIRATKALEEAEQEAAERAALTAMSDLNPEYDERTLAEMIRDDDTYTYADQASEEQAIEDKTKMHASDEEKEEQPEIGAEAYNAEGLLWVNTDDRTAYSIQHGHRISLDTTAATESGGSVYRRILAQMKGNTAVGGEGEPLEPKSQKKRRRKRAQELRNEELSAEATVLEPYAEDDVYCEYFNRSKEASKVKWRPITASGDPAAVTKDPDRVVFHDDIKGMIFRIPTKGGEYARTLLLSCLLSSAGLYFPLLTHSHSPYAIASSAATVPNADRWPSGLLSKDLSAEAAAVTAVTSQQKVWLSQELIGSPDRQNFVRRALHLLIGSADSRNPDGDSTLRVHLQCSLLLFEGKLLSERGSEGAEAARSVAKSLLQASEASSTDLRLWTAYVELEESCGGSKTAVHIAHRALSMLQSLPTRSIDIGAPGLWWSIIRLSLGLSLTESGRKKRTEGTTREVLVHEGVALGVPQIILPKPKVIDAMSDQSSRNTSLHMLVSMASGCPPPSLDSASSAPPTPTQISAARIKLKQRMQQQLDIDTNTQSQNSIHMHNACGLDNTKNVYFFTMALAWFELLTGGGLSPAEKAVLDVINVLTMSTTSEPSDIFRDPKHTPDWHVNADDQNAVTCERLNVSLCALLHCAAIAGMSGANKMLKTRVIEGLMAFSSSPALLSYHAMLDVEAAGRWLANTHIQRAMIRRRDDWESGPLPMEWQVWLDCTIRRCGADSGNVSPFDWSPAGRSRARRAFETVASHPTGRRLPLLWWRYIDFELQSGCYTRAKRLHVRALHSCPSVASLWEMACDPSRLRGSFRSAELSDLLELMDEKGLRLSGGQVE